MVEYEWKKIEIQCPEGQGEAILSFQIPLDYSSNKGIKKLNKNSMKEWEWKCNLRDELLDQGKKCEESCQGSDELKYFMQSIISV